MPGIKNPEDLELAIQFYTHRKAYPSSRGLISLESKLYDSTSISQEGLFGKIKETYQRFIDRTVVALNRIAGIFVKLTNEERSNLSRIRSGELSSKDVSLPISRGAVVGTIKFISAIIGWCTLGSLTKFMTSKIRNSRLKDDASLVKREELSANVKKYEDMLKAKGERIENEKASGIKMSIYQSLSGCAHWVADKVKGIKWQEVEKKAAKARQAYDANDDITKKAHSSRNVVRTVLLGSVLSAWVGITVWILKKVVGVFKKLIGKFKGSTEKDSGAEFNDIDYNVDY